MRYFTSDIHFCDKYTFNNESRPFKNVSAYDRATIKLWNKVAKKDDTIYVVGDMLDCDARNVTWWQDALKYVKKINAKIILIMGNNEWRIVDNYFGGKFNKFREYCLSYGIHDVKKNDKVSFGGYDFYLTHEPKDYKKKYINLCGHLHRSMGLWFEYGLNVCCDLNHFRLFDEEEILYQVKQKEKYWQDENFHIKK
ncbi:MAG: metallophosphoesterase [Clostridia bacterium]|nr:metallophosphoesterase [Clostridia bacterium]